MCKNIDPGGGEQKIVKMLCIKEAVFWLVQNVFFTEK
jgi:hypothetical protein